jgi:hypothetical protein
MSLPVLGPVYIIAILTAASLSIIQLKCVFGATATPVTTLGVGTDLGTAAIVNQAFINI